MGIRIRVALLLMLCAAAALTVAEALGTMKRADDDTLPREIYAQFSARADSAEFYLRAEKGFVAVFSGPSSQSPIELTDIELSGLREGDRAMLIKGIPVPDEAQLLLLLEDLGS